MRLARDQQLRIYALVDGALLHASSQDTGMSSIGLPVMPEGVAATPEEAKVLPQLVPLSDLADAALDRRLQLQWEWARARHCVTWLASEMDKEALSTALATRMTAQLEGGISVLLRLADARVLPVLAEVLTEMQRADFLLPMNTWWYCDRAGELRCLSGEKDRSRPDGGRHTPLELNQEQEDRLLAAARADEVDRLLRTHAADASELPVEPARRHQWIQGCIDRATTWSIASELDLALFCLMDLELGAHFERAPEWQERLTQVKQGQTCLRDLL